uniref:Uncharacterized protein n=1 Tax=Romanomermis culicivorax TaxID=13658 RepID=A0A915L9P3_ROMCU
MPFAPKFKPYVLRYHHWGLPLRTAVTILAAGSTAFMGLGIVLTHYFVAPSKPSLLDWLGATETQMTDKVFASNFKQSLAVFRRNQEKDVQNEIKESAMTRIESRIRTE